MTSNNRISFSLLIAILLVTAGCTKNTQEVITRADAFPQIYTEQPRSIAVLPPLNSSPLLEASDYFLKTIEKPLTDAGYEVIPQKMISEAIKNRNLGDTEALYALPVKTLHESFGSDAVLYTHITHWNVDKTGLLSRLIIAMESEIISTKTSQQLWRYNSSLNIDLSAVSSSGGSIYLSMKKQSEDDEKVIRDRTAYALQLNRKLTRDLPFGPGHEHYSEDQETEIRGSIPEKSILRSRK